MTKQDVFDQCTIEDNVVKLPDVQLERPLYMEVNKALQGIGGKWNRKEKGFLFPTDPAVLLGRVQGGEKINLKKDFQYFATPDEMADDVVEMADLPSLAVLRDDFTILEPSAGQGAIVNAIHRRIPGHVIYVAELMEQNRLILSEMRDIYMLGEDFLTIKPLHLFDRIIANPLFTKNQDIDHVLHMYKHLKSGGRIVSIMSNHWREVNHQKCVEFRQWIDEKICEGPEAEIREIGAGTFKASGTMVGGCIVRIDKPYD